MVQMRYFAKYGLRLPLTIHIYVLRTLPSSHQNQLVRLIWVSGKLEPVMILWCCPLKVRKARRQLVLS